MLTVVYTYFGGIKAVVWVDALQMGLYLLGAVVGLVALQILVPGGWGNVLAELRLRRKARTWSTSPGT